MIQCALNRLPKHLHQKLRDNVKQLIKDLQVKVKKDPLVEVILMEKASGKIEKNDKVRLQT